MRHVMTSREVVTAFLTGPQTHARNGKGSCAFSDKQFLSYSTVVGRKQEINSKTMLFLSERRYSHTTGKQLNWLYWAASKRNIPVFYCTNELGPRGAIDCLQYSIASHLERYENKRCKQATKDWALRSLLDAYKELTELVKLVGEGPVLPDYNPEWQTETETILPIIIKIFRLHARV